MATLQVGHDLAAKVRTADVSVDKNVRFKDLFLSDTVLSGLTKAGFHHPSPIQLNAIPFGRCGLDLIVQAKSGTGKTCVFSVIALEAVVTGTATLQVVILAPTREIAMQIADVMIAIGQCVKDLVVSCFIGGRPVAEDKVSAKGCHIAVGTPGRLFQLVELGVLSCESVRLFVLDEADKLLQANFQSQINSVYSMLPVNKQMIAASATYPEELAQFVTKYMQDPTFVRLNPKDMALLGIKQYVYEIPPPPDKYTSNFECKIKAVVHLLEGYNFRQALVFSNYHSHAKDLSDACNSVGLTATFISGNLEQSQRLEAIQMLKEFKCRVLISTDLTSRGIDASNVDLVLNLDVPQDWETYMHRTGRAGRFGSLGAVISVVMKGSENKDLFKISQVCDITLYPIYCVDGNISIGEEPVCCESCDGVDIASAGAQLNQLKSSQKANKLKSRKKSKTAQVLVGDDLKNLPEPSKNRTISSQKIEAVPCQIPTIPSLPELMMKKTTKKRTCLSYDDLLESYSLYKQHGILKDWNIQISDSSNSSSDDTDGELNGTNRSISTSDTSSATECSEPNLPALDNTNVTGKIGTSLHNTKISNHTPVNHGIDCNARCTASSESCFERSMTEGSAVISRKKRDIARRNKVSRPRSKQAHNQTGDDEKTQHERKKTKSQSEERLRPIPILLPRYSSIETNISLNQTECNDMCRVLRKQSMIQWYRQYVTNAMLWYQYICMESWRSFDM